MFLKTNWYIRRFSFVFELCCLCKGFSRYLKYISKNLHYQSKKKTSTYIIYGNDETQAQKSLIPTQKPNRFDHKHYKRRRVLKSELVFTINNGDCDARWSMSFCLSTRVDNLVNMNHRPFLYFIKQDSLEWFEIHKTLMMTWAGKKDCLWRTVLTVYGTKVFTISVFQWV